MNNYTVYHLHSDLSNGVTNIDSVTKFQEYIDKAKDLGMTALAFSEHGNIFEWWHKKCAIEKAGMKYIHSEEFYLTETINEKIRDNYHCILIAKNFEGFKELNNLITKSFCRSDNHFYYVPRISFDELFLTSDNILITTACIGSVLYKGNEDVKLKFLKFLSANKHRCFLEIQHHNDIHQKEYNKKLYELSEKYNIPLIAGTDTHALNDRHVIGRKILQKAKNIKFPDEDSWDLTFKSYDTLCEAFQKQGSIPKQKWLEAIENTNLMSSMVSEFQINKKPKYPKLYENPIERFTEHIALKRKSHPYVNKRYSEEKIDSIIETELEAYKKTNSIEFMLLQEYLRDWEKNNGIQCGYSRGSVSGSMIAYILGITEMDSIKFGLNFFRFINPDRVTLADIDTDYSNKDRSRVKQFLLDEHMGLPKLHSSEIITFNTIALKGAIRDVGRALEMPLFEVDEISKQCNDDEDTLPLRNKYKELFEYVDIVNGSIVSIGTHPSGVLISDLNIEEDIGLCSTSNSDYPVSMLNMKELEDLMYVKLDILGLDNIDVINETCKRIGIDRLSPDNVDLNDMNVWESIRNDTTGIFQWESKSSELYLKRFMSDETLKKVKNKIPNFSMIKWFSFGNGLIRPSCASFRDEVANGIFYDNGLKELNEFLAPEMCRITMQETIMQFLVNFCGYTNAESDTVRRAIAKKSGTENLLPEISQRFIDYTSGKYNVSKEKCKEVIEPFLQIINDASRYSFSWNHSDSYSCIGYICGYLRYYYPLEYLTVAFNVFSDNEEKTVSLTKYAQKLKIKINPAKFRYSKSTYNSDSKTNTIYKGMASIKFLNTVVSDELYSLKDNKYDYFFNLLYDINTKTSIDSRQLNVLIKLDFFKEFGNAKELLRINDIFEMLKQGQAKQIPKDKIPDNITNVIMPYVNGNRKDGKPAKSYTIIDINGLLAVFEKYIKDLDIFDFDYKMKIQDQYEYLGYVDIKTGHEEDRPILFVKDIYPVKRKKDNKQFGYNVITRSIGSGIESRFTVYNPTFFETPIKKGDVLYCDHYDPDGIYYILTTYHILQ